MKVRHFWKEKRKKGELGKKSFRMYHISEKTQLSWWKAPKQRLAIEECHNKQKWPGFSSLALLSYWLWRTWERMALAMNPTCRFNGMATEDFQLAMFHTEDFLYGSSKLLSIHRSTSPSYFCGLYHLRGLCFLKCSRIGSDGAIHHWFTDFLWLLLSLLRRFSA